MSKDIRSYFTILSTKTPSNLSKLSNKSSTSTKKRSKALESSDEDVIPETPLKQKKEKTFKKRKVNLLSSDSEDDKDFKPNKSSKEKLNESKHTLKLINAADILGNEPVKQAKVPDRPKSSQVQEKVESSTNKKHKRGKKALEKEKFEDKKFEETLLDLDDDFLSQNIDKLDETIKEAENKFCKKIADSTVESRDANLPKTLTTTSNVTPNQNVTTPEKEIPQSSLNTLHTHNGKNDSEDGVKPTSNKNDASTPSRKRKTEEYDANADMARHEKKRHSAILYQKYLNRSGPVHHGMKEIPKGKPDCLKNLCFIRTGVLDSLDNDEFEILIKEHGGRIVHTVSKKVNFVVAGEDPGPAKIEKATSYGIKIISEDDVLDLIRTKSGLQTNEPKETSSLDRLIDGLNHETATNVSSTKSKKKSPTKVEPRKDIEVQDFYGKKSSKEKHSTLAGESQKLNGDVSGELKASKDFEKIKAQSDGKSSSSQSATVVPEGCHQEIGKTQDFQPWTEKYKPANVKSIIGQQGDKSCMKRLMIWLGNWFKNHSGKNKPKLTRPTPWAKNDDGSFFKAALLSGPPGIGKTTTAHLVAKELGFDVVEFNASDTRNKKLLQEELSQLLSSKSLAGFFTGGASPTKKHVLLMDEVDGMAGNEDRGGIQELINLIKNSSIPIICMCNDRNHPKIRSLVNYCYDLRFSRPRLEQIKGAMMSVCFKEGIDITPNALNEVVIGAGMDIRQILTNLSVWSAGEKSLSIETTTKEAKSALKDTPLGQWDVCHKVFSEAEQKKMSITDRARLFYYDYSLAPLFVQENYLKVIPHAPKEETLKRFSAAAESISMGDLVDKQIRSSNNWSLLDVQAMCASVIPGHYLSGHVGGQIDFPSWLGKNSKKNKFNRLLSEIQAHMRTSISGSRTAVNLDYVTHLRDNIAKPLITHGMEGIPAALEIMHSYNLMREDLDSIIELSQWPKQKDPMNMIDSKVKAAFTRAYNKSTMLPYSTQVAAVKKKGAAKQNDDLGDYDDQEEDIESNPEDNDDITNDAMIKAKKTSGSNKKESESKPTTSKRTTTSGNRSRKKK